MCINLNKSKIHKLFHSIDWWNEHSYFQNISEYIVLFCPQVTADDAQAVNFLLESKITPMCLRIMENDTELNKICATFIMQQFLQEETGIGLQFVCAVSFFADVGLFVGLSTWEIIHNLLLKAEDLIASTKSDKSIYLIDVWNALHWIEIYFLYSMAQKQVYPFFRM